jgi:octaprenyl-diphosphate synthase
VPLVDRVSRYIVKHRGKSLRPLLVILAARLAGGANQNTYLIAATVELLHTATLVHDDVVDEAELRRGFPSINAVWKNKVAVLMGDYLLSKSLILATETASVEVMNILSETAKKLSRGELRQIENVWRQRNSESDYYEIIADKTAALLATCTDLGALSMAVNGAHRRALRDYGFNLGMAFQIKDDLLDYESSAAILGKPAGNDIKEKKYTLPLIYALQQAPAGEARKIRRALARGADKRKTAEIVAFAKRYGGIDYARAKMREYRTLADNALVDFRHSDAYKTAVDLLDFVIAREK